jgi:hypothetical protein
MPLPDRIWIPLYDLFFPSGCSVFPFGDIMVDEKSSLCYAFDAAKYKASFGEESDS